MSENSTNEPKGKDYSATLYLPQTAFPMRAGLPRREPELADYWRRINLYKILRQDSAGREPYILHDGPPYANGSIHIGHALNKVLKDTVCRSRQMQGYNANYVPGWDCHGLPIEWKVEEEYRAKGRNKDEIPVAEFRRQCRAFAAHWVTVQAEEFERLGIIGAFADPYKTMDYKAEARIAGELMQFAAAGQLYRGSRPVMWSVVERTALAEAEVEYHDVESEMIWVKFPVLSSPAADLRGAFVVIWTTTPWTIPANRAVCYGEAVAYNLYEVRAAKNAFGPQKGEKLLLAAKPAEACAQKAGLELQLVRPVSAAELAATELAHPLRGAFAGARGKDGGEAYAFRVPLLAAAHVSDEAGTGFVHTAPSHGREDFDAFMAAAPELQKRGIDAAIPFPVDDAGYYTADAPGLDAGIAGKRVRVLDDKGKEGGANKAVIAALIGRNLLFARGRLKHAYPHSWRSKKPVIFRNTPQWFAAMDKDLGHGDSLRKRALRAIDKTRFVPPGGQNRLRAMVADRPDWVLSRQRVWGVPITLFVNDKGAILRDDAVDKRIIAAFEQEGADAWFAQGARERFLQERAREPWQKIDDILDVWFDSGCTHAFVLDERDNKARRQNGTNLRRPADVYLEGSDQHRGWFQSSLLEACGTFGQAPFKTIVTHGFTLDDKGRKMSKSLGNVVRPQDIIKTYGADILRLWVMSGDYWEDQRLGRDIVQTNVDAYRKLRNTIRWALGALNALAELPALQKKLADARFDADIAALEAFCAKGGEPPVRLPELERYMLAQLYGLDKQVRAAYEAFDFKRIVRLLLDFAINDLSAFYFDIRKDMLYCDAPSSRRRLAALFTLRAIFERFITWLAPLLPFTAEEAWQEYKSSGLMAEEAAPKPAAADKAVSVHCEQFRPVPAGWQHSGAAAGRPAEKWQHIHKVRRAVTGALEQARAAKAIGSSLEARVTVYIEDKNLYQAICDYDDSAAGGGAPPAEHNSSAMADICITSGFEPVYVDGGRRENTIKSVKAMPKQAFTLPDAPGIGVVWHKAADEGYKRCARSWRWTADVGSDPEYPDVSARDAAALREKHKLGLTATQTQAAKG